MTSRTKVGQRRRRSKRLALRVPVIVYGRLRDGSALREKTQMLSLSAHGGMLTLAVPMQRDQMILLVNEVTGEEQECRVVYVGSTVADQAEVGVAFVSPAPNFWQVSFPPVNRKSSPN